ncbi:hypothetical protein GCM10022242_14910 [Nocardioides panacisoli]|uniref:DNA primase n=1 Tax=Nocardioides panacisoli TaxID=627624 RepID=A0ABP7IAQ6_9ACTN
MCQPAAGAAAAEPVELDELDDDPDELDDEPVELDDEPLSDDVDDEAAGDVLADSLPRLSVR